MNHGIVVIDMWLTNLSLNENEISYKHYCVSVHKYLESHNTSTE